MIGAGFWYNKVMAKIKNNYYLKLGLIFLAIGLVGLILPFVSFGTSDDYAILQAMAEQEQEQVDLHDQFISESTGNETAGPLPTPQPSAPPVEKKPASTPDPNHVAISNRLVIPKIKVDMPIFAGDSANLLLKGGWLFPGTARPGQPGNAVIFGHRFRYLPPITNTFYSLDKVVVGDTFIVSWQGNVYTYKIKEIKVIDPTDFSILHQSLSKNEMTLITCTPLWTTKQRLAVIGEMIN